MPTPEEFVKQYYQLSQSNIESVSIKSLIHCIEAYNKILTNELSVPTVKVLGKVATIGELKKMINVFPDDTYFGFRNQPRQSLCEIDYHGMKIICFQ